MQHETFQRVQNSKNLVLKFHFEVPWVRINSLSIVVGAIDHTLLLMFLQDTGNNRLSNDTDATIIHHGRPECVEPLCVYICVGLQQINILIFRLHHKHEEITHIGKSK